MNHRGGETVRKEKEDSSHCLAASVVIRSISVSFVPPW